MHNLPCEYVEMRRLNTSTEFNVERLRSSATAPAHKHFIYILIMLSAEETDHTTSGLLPNYFMIDVCGFF